MKIASIGNLCQPVPAIGYGGTQRAMAQMAAFQAAICAHDVTVYAASDSALISFSQKVAQDLGLECAIASDRNSIQIRNSDGRLGFVRLRSGGIPSIGYTDPEEARKQLDLFSQLLADEKKSPFDIIHAHHRGLVTRALSEAGLIHKTLCHQHNATLERDYQNHPYPLICISQNQAERMQRFYNATVHDVIYHGMDFDTYTATNEHAGYLAWIGRFLEEKGTHRAIEIAKCANRPLLIAGSIFSQQPQSEIYFREKILPLIDYESVDFLDRIKSMTPVAIEDEIASIGRAVGKSNPVIFCGTANEAQKQTLYGNAAATLFPISWAEPFGLVMIESMACGTPVIGYGSLGKIDCGSVREVIDDGITGFVLNPRDEAQATAQAVVCVDRAEGLDRQTIRDVFEQRWTSQRVAQALDTSFRRFLCSHAFGHIPARGVSPSISISP